MAHHYSSPYHQPYHSGGGGSDRYHDEDDERRYHRSSRRGDDRHDPYETRGRFQSGSNRNYDQAPSIHVCKSRDYDNYVSDEHNNALENDCSERSFQRGMDPIERDWGDSRSRDNYGGRGGNSLIRSRHSCDSLNSGITHSQHSNATYKPRPTYDDDDQDYHRVSPCNSSRCGDTRSTAASTCYSASQRGHHSRGDQGEQARSSRPAPRRASLVTQDHDRRFCSNASASGSSVCSRSAPLRRTPIPREPSLYRPDSSQHSSNSGRRTFAYHRRVTPPTNSQRGSYNTYKHHLQHPHMVPPEHIDIVLSQERERQRQYSRRSSCSGNSSGSGSATNNNNNNNGGTVMVDIAPGVQAPLRGTQETYKAVAKDFYANVSCFGCSLELCCIADVSYVVCPECKVISPLEGSDFEGKEIQRNGLGLGFTYESLFQMQVEIMKDRKTRD